MTAAALRILFVRNLYWPEDFGGNRYPFEVTRRLAAKGHVLRVVTGRAGGMPPPPTPPAGVDIKYFRVVRKTPLATHLTNVMSSINAVGKALREFEPDVSIVASYDVGLAYFFRPKRPPTAFVYHSAFRPEAIERLKSGAPVRRLLYRALHAYSAWLERHILRAAERIVAVSDFSEVEIRRRAPEAGPRIVRIPTGVDTSFFVPGDQEDSRRTLGIPRAETVLIVVGRLVPVKRYDRAIDAAAILRSRGHSVTLLVVGVGPERRELEERARAAGLERWVRFLGYRTGLDLRDALVAADLQLCTSEFENLSLALLEGLSVGTPVVSVPTGGTVDLLSRIDPDLLATGTDPLLLANRIEFWLRDRERRLALSHVARSYVRAEHDWDSVVGRIEDQLVGLAKSVNAAI